MKITRIASSPDQNARKISSVEKDVSDLKKDIKNLEKDVKSLGKELDKANKILNDLNIGQRRWWQQRTVFTSLQRKIERFEKIEDEWKKYKENIDSTLKRVIEKKTQARPQ